MQRWQLLVWTRFAAPLEQVWRDKTDVRTLAAELLPLRLRVDDPERLQRMLRGELPPGRVEARLGGPLGLLGIDWPLVIEQSLPMQELRDSSENALLAEFRHRHRFEPTVDGRVRYVDDVRFAPAFAPRLVAGIMRSTFVRRHRRAARHLPVDPQVVGIAVLRKAVGEEA